MSRRTWVHLREDNLENIQVPDIQAEPIPDIQPEIPEKWEYITFTMYLDKLLDSMIKMWYQMQSSSWWEGIILSILIRAVAVIYTIGWLLKPIFDPLVISMQDILYDIWVAFIQFKNAVEKDYQGDWIKGVLELTLRVILLQTLASALNIPSINQLWTTIKNSVNGIINEFNTLTNEINEGFSILSDWFESVIGELPDWLEYILQEQIGNLRREFNTLLHNMQNAFISEINELKQTYFRDIDEIKKWINTVDNEIKQFQQNLEPSIRETIKKLVTPVGFEAIWNLLQDLWSTISLTFQVMEYTLYGSIIAVLSIIKTWGQFTTEVDLTLLLREIVDDVIYERGPFIELANKIASEVDDILFKYEKGLSNKVKLVGITENDIDIKIQ